MSRAAATRYTQRPTRRALDSATEPRVVARPATLRYLDERSVTVHVLETREAVKVYNELAEREAVGGLFHSTC